jgi:hypothetical protein
MTVRRLFFKGYSAGLSNCILSLEIGVGLAHLTDRVLVPYGFDLPWCPDGPPTRENSGRRQATLLDLLEIPGPVDGSYLSEVDIPSDVVRCNWPPVYESVFSLESTPSAADFFDFCNGRAHVLAFSPAERRAINLCIASETLGLYSYFFYLEPDVQIDLLRIMRALRPKREYRALARGVVKRLGTFNAVHLRRGDFAANSFTPRSGVVEGGEIAHNLASRLDTEVPFGRLHRWMSRGRLFLFALVGHIRSCALPGRLFAYRPRIVRADR